MRCSESGCYYFQLISGAVLLGFRAPVWYSLASFSILLAQFLDLPNSRSHPSRTPATSRGHFCCSPLSRRNFATGQLTAEFAGRPGGNVWRQCQRETSGLQSVGMWQTIRVCSAGRNPFVSAHLPSARVWPVSSCGNKARRVRLPPRPSQLSAFSPGTSGSALAPTVQSARLVLSSSQSVSACQATRTAELLEDGP